MQISQSTYFIPDITWISRFANRNFLLSLVQQDKSVIISSEFYKRLDILLSFSNMYLFNPVSHAPNDRNFEGNISSSLRSPSFFPGVPCRQKEGLELSIVILHATGSFRCILDTHSFPHTDDSLSIFSREVALYDEYSFL